MGECAFLVVMLFVENDFVVADCDNIPFLNLKLTFSELVAEEVKESTAKTDLLGLYTNNRSHHTPKPRHRKQ